MFVGGRTIMATYRLGDKWILEVEPDDMPQNPRKDYDPFGHMVCWHRRYDLGDKHDYATPSEFWEDMKDSIAIIANVFMYDHSAIAFSLHSFYGRVPQGHAEFDSMQVGYMYLTKEDLQREYDTEDVTDELREKALAIFESELKVYEQYVNGQVYCYTLYTLSPCEHCEGTGEVGDYTCNACEGEGKVKDTEDSCCGFYGDDPLENGMSEDLPEEARALLKAAV
jgi:hypothetical protein